METPRTAKETKFIQYYTADADKAAFRTPRMVWKTEQIQY